MTMTVVPLFSAHMTDSFDLYSALLQSLEAGGESLRRGDVLVVSSKYVSVSEGRVLDMGRIRVSERGGELSGRYALLPKTAEVILRESEAVLGGMAGFVMSATAPFAPAPPEHAPRPAAPRRARARRPPGLLLAPNSGIDMSNAGGGRAILYPSAPSETAESLRRKVQLGLGAAIGVILADSRLMPARVGTSGVAVGCAGILPVRDRRSHLDLDGSPLKVTFQALADNLATAANHVMGEGAESTPFAIIRDSGALLASRRQDQYPGAVPAEQCVYVRSLSGMDVHAQDAG